MKKLFDLVLEGVYDPGILKAVFLAGGPASGKSFVVQQIFGISGEENIPGLARTFSMSGLKMVNSDVEFTLLMKKSGLDPSMLRTMPPDEFKKFTSGPGNLRDKAKSVTDKLKDLLGSGRIGMVIDGTGRDINKIKTQKEQLESFGYDTAMIFVNTDLDVALERNKNRERQIPDALVTQYWKDVQSNMGKFQSLFHTFVIVDNNIKADAKFFLTTNSAKIKKIDSFIKSPVKNAIGKAWIEYQLDKKKHG